MSLGGGEIITIQFGRSSNFVGSHFWNIQDALGRDHSSSSEEVFEHSEIDKNPLLQQREVRNQVVYTPRLLLYDLKGNLGSLRVSSHSSTHSNQHTTPTWRGEVERHETASLPKNPFILDLEKSRNSSSSSSSSPFTSTSHSPLASSSLKRRDYHLEDSVQYWTDYRQMEYHSRSFFELSSFVEGLHPFSSFLDGQQILRGGSAEETEEMTNHARRLIEECDRLSGVQMFVDSDNGFSSFSCDYIQLLREEFLSSKDPILLFAISELDPTQRHRSSPTSTSSSSFSSGALQKKTNASVALNRSLLLTGALDQIDLAVPIFLTPDSLGFSFSSRISSFRPKSIYHSSAILASALDSITLPYRLCSRNTLNLDLKSFGGCVASGGAKVAALSTSYSRLTPSSSYTPSSSLPTLFRNAMSSLFSPSVSSGTASSGPFHASGLTIDLLPNVTHGKDDLPYTELAVLRGMDPFWFNRGEGRGSLSRFEMEAEMTSWMASQERKAGFYLNQALPLPTSFPNFFGKKHHQLKQEQKLSQGGETKEEEEEETLDKIGSLTHLQVGPVVREPLRRLSEDLKELRAEEHGMGKDEAREIQEQLLNLIDHYEPTSPLEV